MADELRLIRAVDVSLQAVEVVARMKAVDPVVLWALAIEPCPVRILAFAAVQHRLPGHVDCLCPASECADTRQQRAPQHVRVVDRYLLKSDIAEARAGRCPFARKLQDPVAGTARGFEVSRVPENFEAVDERLPDQTAPDDGRLSPRDPARPGCEGELIAPAQIGIARRSVGQQPIEAYPRPLGVVRVPSRLEAPKMTPGHVAHSLGRGVRFDAQQGANVEG